MFIFKALTASLFAFAIILAVGTASAGTSNNVLDSTDGQIVIHPINHATFAMVWNERTILVDPVGGGERFSGLPTPDLILVTHIHGDHMSAETLAGVVGDTTAVIAPVSVVEALGDGAPPNLIPLANGEKLERAGAHIEAIPAYNLSEDRLMFHPKERGDNAYVVTIGGTRVFISGDTEDVPEMRALKDIDAAFLCMNLPFTMTVEAAADAVLEFAPGVVFPYHYRGREGTSDLDAFVELVAENPAIEVRRLDWY